MGEDAVDESDRLAEGGIRQRLNGHWRSSWSRHEGMGAWFARDRHAAVLPPAVSALRSRSPPSGSGQRHVRSSTVQLRSDHASRPPRRALKSLEPRLVLPALANPLHPAGVESVVAARVRLGDPVVPVVDDLVRVTSRAVDAPAGDDVLRTQQPPPAATTPSPPPGVCSSR